MVQTPGVLVTYSVKGRKLRRTPCLAGLGEALPRKPGLENVSISPRLKERAVIEEGNRELCLSSILISSSSCPIVTPSSAWSR